MKKTALLFCLILFCITSFAQTTLHQLLAEENYLQIINQLSTKSQPLSKQERYILALAYKQNGYPNKTINLLLKDSVNNSLAEKKLLSSTFFNTGNYSASKPLCEFILQEEEKNVKNLLRLVEILDFHQDQQKALKYLLDYEADDTTNFEVNKHLASLYQKADSTEKAISTYRRILKQYPDNQSIALKLGKYLYSKKKYPACNDLCSAFLEKTPHHRRFLILGGLANFEAGAHGNTLLLFKRLEAQGDSSFISKKHLGITYYRLEEYDKAINYLYAAMDYNTEGPEVNFFLGSSLGQSNSPHRGIPYLLRAIDLISPSRSTMEKVYNKLAIIHYDTGDYSTSLQYYQKAYNFSPKTTQYIYHQAAIYDHKLNDLNKAQELYKKFLLYTPKNLDPKKGSDLYTIQLKKVVENRLRELDEESFFEKGYDTSN